LFSSADAFLACPEEVRLLYVRRLRLLRELAHRGTIAAVAEALSFSPSAVSQQLSTLEAEAGVTLLERVGRRVRLTPQAELLVAHTEILLEQLEQAEAELAETTQDLSGTVRVAAFQTAVLSLIPDALTRLAAGYPRLRVEVTELEPERSFPGLVAREFDVVLGEEYPGHPQPRRREIERHHLVTDELRLVTPQAWPVTGELAQLASRPWVMEPVGTPSREWTTAVCRDAGFEPDVRFTSTDLLIHLRLVETGHAAALLPDLAGAGQRPCVQVWQLSGQPVRQVFSAVRRGAGRHPALAALERAIADAGQTQQSGGHQ
jgi:DNA-binding transcriptional LysR family regulator